MLPLTALRITCLIGDETRHLQCYSKVENVNESDHVIWPLLLIRELLTVRVTNKVFLFLDSSGKSSIVKNSFYIQSLLSSLEVRVTYLPKHIPTSLHTYLYTYLPTHILTYTHMCILTHSWLFQAAKDYEVTKNVVALFVELIGKTSKF